MHARSALQALSRRPSAFLRSSWPWRSLAYLLASVPHAALAMAVVFTAYSLGGAAACAAGLLVVAVLGLPVAAFERVRMRLVDPLPTPRRWRGWHGLRARLADQATWRDYGFALLVLVGLWAIDLGVISLAGSLPLILLTAPLQPSAGVLLGLPIAVVGLVLLPLTAYPIAAWAGARAMITRAVLAPRDAEIIRSRARLVDSYEGERRRIERDLHDGTQQRLVALTMKLGLARLDLPAGSPAAAQVAQAHEEAKQTLAELRELIRGVHPKVLTDRGLPAAVQDVAGRSPIPANVDVALPGRLPVPVEVTAYYVVSEALANVAKHSGATRCLVRARVRGGTLVVEVSDDGAGGADPEAGSGLAGLADRVAVVDGVMRLSSPPGGPTSVRVEVPL
ncbi:sensor domain-containing protein [Nonomuraea sp. NPDC005983]|uniref:sensor histidine kinase n=1 Tax=Nonomuraea sp. NPDC005983 TaxID=3155595 RepID=UPI00339E2DD9